MYICVYLSFALLFFDNFKTCHIAKFALPRYVTARNSILSVLQEDSSAIVQEVETHGAKLHI